MKAKKSLGQNFLTNSGVVRKIVEAAELTSNDKVLEIGPGTGVLTKALVTKAGTLIAVEKDRRLIEDLEAMFSPVQVRIVEADILKFEPAALGLRDGEYKIVANLPYYITSYLLRTVFEDWPQPVLLVLMVQKEVAQRILAKPPKMNLLGLSVRYYAEPKLVTYVKKGSFRPTPKVDSAVIKLIPRANLALPPEREEKLFAIWKGSFAGKRKQLLNTLPQALKMTKTDVERLLKSCGIDPKTRPETLDLANWLKLIEKI